MTRYRPRSFREERLSVLFDFIRANSFGVFVSQGAGGPEAVHLPFMIDETRGPKGTLIGHFAKANPHWKCLEQSSQSLAIFSGPHCYVSPRWYRPSTAVPTWNYAAVYARGRAELINDEPRILEMVVGLTAFHEGVEPEAVSTPEFLTEIEPLLKAVIGFELPIEEISGKFKFNQNRSEADREGVIEALSISDNPMERQVAAHMKRKSAI